MIRKGMDDFKGVPDSGNGVLLTLPAKVPKQSYRPAQSNIPNDKQARVFLKKVVADHVRKTGAVPPLTMDELREHAVAVLRTAKLESRYRDYAAILVSNEAWRDTLAQVPYERRLLLLPKCLRVEERCPAPFDEFGLLCKECGLCSIQDLSVEAERLGYAVLVAEGSAIVRQMIETGKIDAVVGVSCINVLEKCFPHMEAAAVPGMAIPLLQDDCVNTTVDLDWVWDLIHLTAADKTYRLDLDGLKSEVQELVPEGVAGGAAGGAGRGNDWHRPGLAGQGRKALETLSGHLYLHGPAEPSAGGPPPGLARPEEAGGGH